MKFVGNFLNKETEADKEDFGLIGTNGLGPSVYEMIAQYNPNTTASANYRDIIHGNIYTSIGFSNTLSTTVISIDYTEIYRLIGSGSSGNGTVIGVSFVSASTAATNLEFITVPIASGSWQMRIRFASGSLPNFVPAYNYVRLMQRL